MADLSAGALYLVVNGLSKHINPDQEYNEKNPGYGIEYQWKDGNKNHILIGGKYLNSLDENSNYLGYGRKYRLLGNDDLHLDGGFVAGGATGYPDYQIAPVLMPMLTAEGKRMGVNFFALPPVDGVTPATIMANFRYKLK